ncbi:MAG: RluA family pseudouridine synthase [Clostridia bacterium]|nr:RluA family pseudouridine synthase [Clostridia bacterium]
MTEQFDLFPDPEDFISVEAETSGGRLDSFVSGVAGFTRSRAQKLIENGSVSVNGASRPKNYRICKGDRVEISVPEAEEYDAIPEDIPLDIRYEDDSVIVVNKPSGMVVHPAPGHQSGTLVNALMHHCGKSLSGIGGVGRPGIVHRIDRDTSGLICVAKTDEAHLKLSAQLKDHTMHREYLMIVTGNLKEDDGTVNAPIGRHPGDRKKMAVLKLSEGRAREAVTHWHVIDRYKGFTYASAVLETGRTHQIRVHMSYIGHPLMGDAVYGGGKTVFERHHPDLIYGQMLHAHALVFTHPETGETLRIEAEMPDNFKKILEILPK